ncbi:hypothetical protein FNYG_14818 [Fusarium nygamai]|uniref:Uncharacterized protein n=1 Tax=Gibberella nygamai TaxID=42673 RepID=A0A2K0UQ13_GIBNY|nr:hypothetical protein FNYG_14818 [Fusarium nygamai]
MTARDTTVSLTILLLSEPRLHPLPRLERQQLASVRFPDTERLLTGLRAEEEFLNTFAKSLFVFRSSVKSGFAAIEININYSALHLHITSDAST